MREDLQIELNDDRSVVMNVDKVLVADAHVLWELDDPAVRLTDLVDSPKNLFIRTQLHGMNAGRHQLDLVGRSDTLKLFSALPIVKSMRERQRERMNEKE